MPQANLTAKFIEAPAARLVPAGKKQIEYWDTARGCSGFGVLVSVGGARSPNGTKTYVLRYRVKATGERRRLSIGDADALSLEEARSKAKKLIGEIENGRDPGRAKQAARHAETFGELAATYLERHAKPKKRSAPEDERILNRDLLPAWRNRKAISITRAEVKALIDGIRYGNGKRDPAPIMANRTLALVRKIFNYAIGELHILENNPCHLVGIDLAEEKARERSRFLRNDEIRAFWRALDRQGAAGQHRAAALFRLELLTGQRDGEVRRMRWDDIEDDGEKGFVWTIPGKWTKNKLDHRVPLSPTAEKIVRDLHNRDRETRERVNASRAKKDKPLLAASEWVFPSAKGDGKKHVGKWPKPFERVRRDSKIEEHFTRHDLRRTLSTKLPGDLKISSDIVDKITNHVEPGVRKVYDRYSYDDEKRDALRKWDDYLLKIVADDSDRETSRSRCRPAPRVRRSLHR